MFYQAELFLIFMTVQAFIEEHKEHDKALDDLLNKLDDFINVGRDI